MYSSLTAYAQESTLLWQRTFGGEGDDHISAIAQDAGGNIYIATTIQSINNFNILLSKVDSEGNTIWNNVIGGSGDEIAASLVVDQNNDVLLLASSTSKDQFLPNAFGYQDVVLMRYSQDGGLVSKYHYGGSFIDLPSTMIINSVGNIVIGGHSRSSDGDLTENNGQFDIWTFEVDYDGIILWQRSFGGNDEDICQKIVQLNNGDYILVGHSASYDGPYSDNRGDYDILIIKMDQQGNPDWQRLYGGSLADYSADVVLMPKGGLLIAGNSFSNDYYAGGNYGGSDAWVIEISKSGELVWEQNYGSYGNESVAALMTTSTGLRLLGTTNSSSLNESTNHGAQDLWLYDIDGLTRDITNQTLFGASGFDSGTAMIGQDDGTILLAGSTTSSDGVIKENNGKNDGWLFKVRQSIEDESETFIHPNPSSGVFYLNNLPASSSITVIDQAGNVVYKTEDDRAFATVIDLSQLPAGVYFLQVESETRQEVKRIVKS